MTASCALHSSPCAEGPAAAILATPAEPEAAAPGEVLGAVLFDPAFFAAVDAILEETPP